MRSATLNQLVRMALLAAISIVLVIFIHFPLLPSAPFLEYDPADIPIFIGTFMYGPIAGFCITVVVALLQALTVSAGSGWIGFVMHTLATGSFALVAGFIYKKYHTLKGAIIALICGTLTMTLVMIPANLFFTVIYMGVPREVVINMLVPVIIPFNLLKAIINSSITMIVYKSIANLLRNSSKEFSFDGAK